VIKFGRALGLGLLIALIACVAYTLIWELYLAATHYRFMDDYIATTLAKARASGKSAADIVRMTTEFDAMRTMYANPLIRLPMTAMEVAPVGLAVSLFSAALLRNPRLLPARANVRAASPSPSPTDPA
jgi:ABC-type sugar transport system permease subunit